MDKDLASKLQRRLQRSESSCTDARDLSPPRLYVSDPLFEFRDIPAQTLKECQQMFSRYDDDNDKLLDFHQIRIFVEKLGHPQTHLMLKSMIKEFDSDDDGKLSFREFMMVYRRIQTNEIEESVQNTNDDHILDVKTARKFFGDQMTSICHKDSTEQQWNDAKQRKKSFQDKLMLFNRSK
ncbi:hypothetical protein GJ496_002878 [Pomphorhynchus laevis]|nr:hypothetical protein GJ496_002878 [Pomphorhynchus laevis]